MTEDKYRLGGGASDTQLAPLTMILLIIAVLAILFLPRKYVIYPLMLAAVLAPFGQQAYLLGMHWYVPRILAMAGLVRMVFAKLSSSVEIASGGFTVIDKLFVTWATLRVVATVLLFLSPQAIFNQAGFLIDSFGCYFLLRFVIQDREDLIRAIRVMVLLVCILAVAMTYEHFSWQPAFRFLGANFEFVTREGAVRAQGPFESAIPAGTFAATLLCLFVWLWRSGESRLLGMTGVVGCLVMTYTSRSSTPLLGVAASIGTIMLWPLRESLRSLRWGIVGGLMALQLVMQAPFWFVINHITLTGGNSSYHRAMLVDGFIRHFSDWWLLGATSSASWGFDMWDQANQFVKEGLSGGLATFVCFVALITRCFSRLGTARKMVTDGSESAWLCWMMGGALLTQVVCFFGNSYSDQSIFSWYVLLALISTVTTQILEGTDDDEDMEGASESEDAPLVYASASVDSESLHLN